MSSGTKTKLCILLISAICFFIGVGSGSIIMIYISGLMFYITFQALFEDDDKKKTNSDSYTYTDRKSREETYKEHILALLAIVMRANGSKKRSELDSVKRTIKRYYATQEERNNALKLFKGMLEEEQNIDLLCSRISNAFSLASREGLMMELFAVAYADGDFEEDEQKIIKEIAQRLGFDTYRYNTIHMLFKKRKKAGFYGDSYIKGENPYGSSNYGGSSGWYGQSSSSSYGGSSRSYSNNNYHSNYSGYTSSFKLSEAYATLGLRQNCTDDEVRAAKKKLLRRHHPDLFQSEGAEAVKNATAMCQSINEAYEVIRKARGMSK